MKRIKYWLKNIITNKRMCRKCCVVCEYYRDCVGEERCNEVRFDN